MFVKPNTQTANPQPSNTVTFNTANSASTNSAPVEASQPVKQAPVTTTQQSATQVETPTVGQTKTTQSTGTNVVPTQTANTNDAVRSSGVTNSHSVNTEQTDPSTVAKTSNQDVPAKQNAQTVPTARFATTNAQASNSGSRSTQTSNSTQNTVYGKIVPSNTVTGKTIASHQGFQWIQNGNSIQFIHPLANNKTQVLNTYNNVTNIALGKSMVSAGRNPIISFNCDNGTSYITFTVTTDGKGVCEDSFVTESYVLNDEKNGSYYIGDNKKYNADAPVIDVTHIYNDGAKNYMKREASGTTINYYYNANANQIVADGLGNPMSLPEQVTIVSQGNGSVTYKDSNGKTTTVTNNWLGDNLSGSDTYQSNFSWNIEYKDASGKEIGNHSFTGWLGSDSQLANKYCPKGYHVVKVLSTSNPLIPGTGRLPSTDVNNPVSGVTIYLVAPNTSTNNSGSNSSKPTTDSSNHTNSTSNNSSSSSMSNSSNSADKGTTGSKSSNNGSSSNPNSGQSLNPATSGNKGTNVSGSTSSSQQPADNSSNSGNKPASGSTSQQSSGSSMKSATSGDKGTNISGSNNQSNASGQASDNSKNPSQGSQPASANESSSASNGVSNSKPSSTSSVVNPSAGNTGEDQPVQKPDGSKASNPDALVPDSNEPGRPATSSNNGKPVDGNSTADQGKPSKGTTQAHQGTVTNGSNVSTSSRNSVKNSTLSVNNNAHSQAQNTNNSKVGEMNHGSQSMITGPMKANEASKQVRVAEPATIQAVNAPENSPANGDVAENKVSANSAISSSSSANSNNSASTVSNGSNANTLPETGMSNESVEFAAAALALAGVAMFKRKEKE